MARAALSKTRALDKSKPPSTQTPTTTHEIVPGKFYETDWNHMLNRDGCEEFIAEIVDEFMDATIGAIFKKYIDRQLLPFTITQARDAIVEIIQWHFLARDDGEQHISSDLGWAEDEEPEPANIDCWAKGSMPKNVITGASKMLVVIPEVPGEKEDADRISLTNVEEVQQEPAELPDAVSDTEELSPVAVEHAETEPLLGKGSDLMFHGDHHAVRSIGTKKKTKTVEETEVKKLSEEITETSDRSSFHRKVPNYCSSYIKAMVTHSSGTKEAMYDEFGYVLAVPKLDPEKLPTHKVNVKYTVIDPTTETAQVKVEAKKMKSGIKKKNKIVSSVIDNPIKATPSKQIRTTGSVKNLPTPLLTPRLSNTSGLEDDYTRQHSMIEDIEVSQGIIVRELGQVKKGPGLYYGRLDLLDDSHKGMKPVSLKISNPGITVADILDRQSPILRPFGESSPLPPIVPHFSHPTKQVS